MFHFTFTPRTLFLLALTLAFANLPVGAQSANKPLQGSVNQDDYLKPNAGPSLSRNDVNKVGDPFGQPIEQFDAPEAAFEVQQQAPPPFALNAEDSGGLGAPMEPMSDSPPPMAPQMAPQQMLQPINPNDPDSSQQMQILWELWHRRVAEEIFNRFDALAQRAFAHSRPIACQAAYAVTRDRKIVNVRLLVKSNNIVFNAMLLGVLKSMDGNPILEFPPGSRRQLVDKHGTFSRNYGIRGFKYTTGDQETYQNKNPHP